MEAGARTPGTLTYAAFGCSVLIGGANFIAVSFSNMELPPLFGATVRFALASLFFILIARARNIPFVRGRQFAGAAAYGLLGFGVAYALLYYAMVGITAGTTSLIVASAPLVTLLIAVVLGQERLSFRGVAGGVLAIAGIGILSRGSLGGELGVWYITAAILGTVAMAASSVIAKAFTEVHPLNMNAIGMVAGTIFLSLGSLLLGESWTLPAEPRTFLAVGWLVLAGSVGLFQLFLYVIRRWTASATVYAVAGMPVVAVALGALLLDQPVTPSVVAGGALVIASVYVGAISRMRGARVAPARDPHARPPE
jgi:drug/metabolite transporter (DMT)-like permease